MHRASRWAQPEGINLTPLLDVIFNLIFFFLLATSVKNEDLLNIALPETNQAEQAASNKEALSLSITSENTIMLKGEAIPPDQLAARLKALWDSGNYSGVIIRGDGRSSLQAGTDVISALKELGITNFNLDVTKSAPRAEAPGPSEN